MACNLHFWRSRIRLLIAVFCDIFALKIKSGAECVMLSATARNDFSAADHNRKSPDFVEFLLRGEIGKLALLNALLVANGSTFGPLFSGAAQRISALITTTNSLSKFL